MASDFSSKIVFIFAVKFLCCLKSVLVSRFTNIILKWWNFKWLCKTLLARTVLLTVILLSSVQRNVKGLFFSSLFHKTAWRQTGNALRYMVPLLIKMHYLDQSVDKAVVIPLFAKYYLLPCKKHFVTLFFRFINVYLPQMVL